jgi:hypothetical protein
MDPLSIATACVSLTAGVTNLTMRITVFVSEVKGARKDMDAVAREITSLHLCLGALKDDGTRAEALFSESMRKNIHEIILNCDIIVQQINDVLIKLSSGRLGRRIQWSLIERDQMNALRSSLESNKTALEVALTVGTISMLTKQKRHLVSQQTEITDLVIKTTAIDITTRQIHARVGVLQDIKQDTGHIKDLAVQIAELRAQLNILGTTGSGSSRKLQDFIDHTKAHAESLLDPFVPLFEQSLQVEVSPRDAVQRADALTDSNNLKSNIDAIMDWADRQTRPDIAPGALLDARTQTVAQGQQHNTLEATANGSCSSCGRPYGEQTRSGIAVSHITSLSSEAKRTVDIIVIDDSAENGSTSFHVSVSLSDTVGHIKTQMERHLLRQLGPQDVLVCGWLEETMALNPILTLEQTPLRHGSYVTLNKCERGSTIVNIRRRLTSRYTSNFIYHVPLGATVDDLRKFVASQRIKLPEMVQYWVQQNTNLESRPSEFRCTEGSTFTIYWVSPMRRASMPPDIAVAMLESWWKYDWDEDLGWKRCRHWEVKDPSERQKQKEEFSFLRA